ncbi:MAG: hypothetical protein JNK21_14510 [Rhodospirillaceae bacterium]|nr:hypothetical protein [Rhodospirillaceae bacterium]
MIVGFSHLTLHCTNIDAAMPLVAPWGYTLDFQQRDVVNPEGKHGLLSTWHPRMHIALFRSPRVLPVELVEYPNFSGQGLSALEPIIMGRGIDAAADNPVGTAIGQYFKSPQSAVPRRDQFNTRLWFLNAPDARSGIVGLVHRTRDFEAAVGFWEKLSGRKAARPDAAGNVAYTGYFSPIAALSLPVIVTEDPAFPHHRTTLDNPGTTVLSFTCSNVERARAAVNPGEALPTTGIFEVCINGKDLRLEIIEAHPGVFIELLQALPKRSA